MANKTWSKEERVEALRKAFEKFEEETTESTDLIIDEPVSHESLVPLSRARNDLKLMTSVGEVKDIINKAELLHIYLKQQNTSLDVQNCAAEIKFLAEHRAGEILEEMEQDGSRQRRGGDRKSKSQPMTLKLDDLGITKNQSSTCQKISQIPMDTLITHMEWVRREEKEITRSSIMRLVNDYIDKKYRKKTGRRDSTTAIERFNKNVEAFIKYSNILSHITNRLIRFKTISHGIFNREIEGLKIPEMARALILKLEELIPSENIIVNGETNKEEKTDTEL